MIDLTDVHVTFNPGTVLETRALRGVTLHVPEGQFLTVIGSNGAGKSTLIGSICGEIPILRGRITVGGTDLTHMPTHRRAGFAGRVFQDPLAGTCADLTIEENLALAEARGAPRGLGLAVTSDRRAAFRERIEVLGLGLEDRLGDRIGLLSGGQRQAVSLVMATLADSRILLLDEHTAALDPRMAAFVIDLTKRLVGELGLTALMITHSMIDALACGERSVMLHQGKIVLDVSGAEREGMTPDDFVALFTRVRGEELADGALRL